VKKCPEDVLHEGKCRALLSSCFPTLDKFLLNRTVVMKGKISPLQGSNPGTQHMTRHCINLSLLIKGKIFRVPNHHVMKMYKYRK